jgi:hypothetical protein
MTLGVSLIVIAVGAILTWAVHPAHEGSVDPQTVGVILMVIGLVAFLLDLMLWSEWGPGYVRRRTVAVDDGYPVRRRRSLYPRRTTVVEDDVSGPPAGPPPGPPP